MRGRLKTLRSNLKYDKRLSSLERESLIAGIDACDANIDAIVKLVEAQFTNVRTNGILKSVLRRIRSIVVSVAVGAAVGFYTGGPIGAIIGGSIGLIGSTLDMAFNDRCHYAMNCKKGWEQNCKTGECIAQEFTEETIGDYGDTDPKQIIDLQGPVKGLKTNPGTTNCRGCGGESYKNNVDNLDVHPFISESSQEPPFSLEGIEEEYGIVSFIQE